MSFITLALTIYSTIFLSKPFILLSLLLEIKHLQFFRTAKKERFFCCWVLFVVVNEDLLPIYCNRSFLK